jgi:hypothetical protein
MGELVLFLEPNKGSGFPRWESLQPEGQRDTQNNPYSKCVRLVISKEPKEEVYHLSPEDGNRSSFQNVVFSSFYNTG